MSNPVSSIKQSVPQYLMAPPLLDFGDGRIIKNLFCYVLRHYGNSGIGVLYYHQGDDVCVQFGDWNGNIIDLDSKSDPLVKLIGLYLHKYNISIYNLLHTIGLSQFQIFLNTSLMLVELQYTVNNLAGPGMLQNLFSNIITTPEVLKIEIIDDRVIDVINAGTGSYTGDLIIKPSRFRQYQLPSGDGTTKAGKYTPLQVQVVR